MVEGQRAAVASVHTDHFGGDGGRDGLPGLQPARRSDSEAIPGVGGQFIAVPQPRRNI